MSKEQTEDLLVFLEPFGDKITELVMRLRDFVWNLYPMANELIYDNYNAVAFGWSHTDRLGHTFCSIAVFRTNKNIHFGFYRGNELSDPEKILSGEGTQYRYILVTDISKFPKIYVEKLVQEAYEKSLSRVKDKNQIIQGQTMVKSVSEKKRSKRAQSSAQRDMT